MKKTRIMINNILILMCQKFCFGVTIAFEQLLSEEKIVKERKLQLKTNILVL